MRLIASRMSRSILSTLTANPKTGSIHSAFSRTVNIMCDDMTWLSLHPQDVSMHPYAVLVECPGRRRHTAGAAAGVFLEAVPGDPVTACLSSVRLVGQCIEIDLSGAELWDPRPRLDSADARLTCEEMLETLMGFVEDRPVVSPFLAAVTGKPPGATDAWYGALYAEAREIVEKIEAGLAVGSRKKVIAGISRAIGLGPGLTPSGDDFVTGLFCGYFCLRPEDGVRKTVFASAASLVHRTPLVSAMMLRAALEGRFPEPVKDLLDSFRYRSEACVSESTERLVTTGATSGEDMFAGLLTFLRAAAACGYDHAIH